MGRRSILADQFVTSIHGTLSSEGTLPRSPASVATKEKEDRVQTLTLGCCLRSSSLALYSATLDTQAFPCSTQTTSTLPPRSAQRAEALPFVVTDPSPTSCSPLPSLETVQRSPTPSSTLLSSLPDSVEPSMASRSLDGNSGRTDASGAREKSAEGRALGGSRRREGEHEVSEEREGWEKLEKGKLGVADQVENGGEAMGKSREG